ncbi:uncharacterized protein LOC125316459 [Rhodamnia argentea]|uniref:Uncharacterized protein LOC125316459 n=1 Tax=Rhodamnia argentea TaxID=178133 RepID=A0ABM3HVX5_9MYRT|nr:uncharacterized protein LOC125316459 [Rhodamnia argentea]
MIAEKVFAMIEEDVAASNAVVAGDVSIASRYAYALFDPGATHSFVSMEFAKKLDVPPKSLDHDLRVDAPIGDFLIADHVYKRCMLRIDDVEMPVDLVESNIQDFDVILGMDWLSTYHATIDCYAKKIIFRPPNQVEFFFSGNCKVIFLELISVLKQESF